MRAPFNLKLATINLILALTLGLANALLYVFLVPPWQHYDENTHFEYVWLAAARNSLPAEGDYDVGMRRAVGRSMYETGFFGRGGYRPELRDPEQDLWFWQFIQTPNPPLYYLAASLPLRFLLERPVETQLYAARLVSTFFFLLTILAAWGIAGVLDPAPPDHSPAPQQEPGLPGRRRLLPMQTWLPLGVALFPMSADLMTSVSNDVGGVVLASLGLWAALDLARRGFRPGVALGALLVLAAGWWTKDTVLLVAPVILLAILLSLGGRKWRRALWALAGLALLALPFLLLRRDEAVRWYRSATQTAPLRQAVSRAVLGAYALALERQTPASPPWAPLVFQPLPYALPNYGVEAVYTLGAWIWADQPGKVFAPGLGETTGIHQVVVEVNETPQFFAHTIHINPATFQRLWVAINSSRRLSEGLTTGQALPNSQVYYDGLVLLPGEWPLDQAPVFSGPMAEAGEWGGRPFTNMLRNGSAESAGLRFSPWADRIGALFLADDTRPSVVLASLLDLDGAGWFYYFSAARLFRTFWGQFGWGSIPLLGSRPYRFFIAVTVFLLLGLAIDGLRRLLAVRHIAQTIAQYQVDLKLLLLVAAGIAWFIALTRSPVYLGAARLFLPVARYMAVALLPTLLFLGLGWQAWGELAAARLPLNPGLARKGWACLTLVALLAYNVYALTSIWHYGVTH